MQEFKNLRREIALGASQNFRSAGRAPSMFCRIDPMFTIEDRSLIRSMILEKAASDRRIVGAAITGSGATGAEDQWSDIDLAFSLAEGVERPPVLSEWTTYMYMEQSAIHHVDVPSGAWLYRVFLLPGTLQVDLSFVEAAEFRPLASTFKLVFGSANEVRPSPSPSAENLVGLGWLYALHARSCIVRGRLWQAEYMVTGVRNHALALACVRHGLPAVHGRGTDQLPSEVTATFDLALVSHLDPRELSRAFRVVIDGFIAEVRCADKTLADRLESTTSLLKESLNHFS